ncbi:MULTISPECIES: rhamnogalacturonan acetylesterase [Asticcacaulis]|uniref:rhamnogalacturonan acetylesterase n=1 Tax=Asticcacaulis TaxID=76890 RepID=UPI001FD9337E|nr:MULTISPECIES: rhamnogalacturonan acetylesterase [Asticcacaulis]MBP2160815.1 lysophospholipase L1-like esterase [Asticcacaulis solisilvae]MDR6801981.1 lysophospholipase L1-like esterase [Asticcacaulis sp. BE141]
MTATVASAQTVTDPAFVSPVAARPDLAANFKPAAPGDYEVTVALRGTGTPAAIWAEDRRLMVAPVALKAGETKSVKVIVNVRNPYLVQAEQDVAKGPKVGLRGSDEKDFSWDDQLILRVTGAELVGFELTPVSARRILIAGDSTVADQNGSDYASWGQMLPRFLDAKLSVANHARSGETMKSFVTSLRWDKLLSELRAGDVVLIQFGHNDEKKQWPRTYAAADGAYPAWLSAFVADVRQRGGQPVLVTPVARRAFKDGKVENTHAGYDAAVRGVARQLNVPLIDLTEKTTRMYESLGPDVSLLAFGNKGADKTHHNGYGAYTIACYVAKELTGFKDLKVGAAVDMPACSPDKPQDPKTFTITLP